MGKVIKLTNARLPGESFGAYQIRRANQNAQIKEHLKGKLIHVSAKLITLPAEGVDAQADEAIRKGEAKVHGIDFTKDGKLIRLCVLKGTTFRHADARAVL